MKLNVHNLPPKLPTMLFFIFDKFVPLHNKSGDPLGQPGVSHVLLELFRNLIHILDILYFFSLLSLVQIIFEGHHTLCTSLLRNNELVPIYFLVIIVIFLLSFIRKI